MHLHPLAVRSALAAATIIFSSGIQSSGTALADAPAPNISNDQAAVAPTQQDAARQQQIDALQQNVDAINQKLAELRGEPATTNASPEDNWKFGYADGFYIRDDDDFKLQVNGLFDARYSFVQAQNLSGLNNTALGTNHTGDMSGFNLNTAQLAVSGILYQHILFKAMGNFGSTSSFTAPVAGTFQLNEYWGAYSVSPELNFRAGSFVIPIVPLKTIANYGGSQFPDPSDVTVPFAPGYGLGADVYGALAEKTFSYDVMVGNGSNSQNLVDSTVPASGRDNRLSFYTREQYAGSGKLSDFLEEPDLQNHADFVWIAGVGLGYESQNSSANAFPGPQTGTMIPGLAASTGPGFDPNKYTLDGDMYRAAIDFRTKYRGWSTYADLQYQDIHAESGTIIPGSTRTNVEQFGYFLQSGYFLIPSKLDIAGRFGQLYTLGFSHHMDVYTLGMDYYLFRENMKLQLAETFIPNEAALTSGNGSIVNTQDLITQVQVQVKF